MRYAFCFSGVSEENAVGLAWSRIFNQFVDAGANAEKVLVGGSLRCLSISDLKCLRSFDFVVCLNVWQVLAIRFLLFGSKARVIYWIQGLVAEESYLKHKSRVRYLALRVFEYMALYFSYAYIYVSEFMRGLYGDRCSASLSKPSLILPCTSDLTMNENVYRNPFSYCYLGGMAPWQNFEIIVRLMSGVVRGNPEAFFSVATKEVEECWKILSSVASDELLGKVKVVSLSKKSEVQDFLSSQQFGFLIRDDHVINNVSSPIKLAEYLSCGVNVVTTNAIRSYSPVLGVAGHIIEFSSEADVILVGEFSYPGSDVSIGVFERHFSVKSAMNAIEVFLCELGARYG